MVQAGVCVTARCAVLLLLLLAATLVSAQPLTPAPHPYVQGHAGALAANQRAGRNSSSDSTARALLRDWMGRLEREQPGWADSRTLQQVTLPGTHDSGAYYLTAELAPDATGSPELDALIKLAEALGIPIQDVITPWALAQDRTFYEQCQFGIRYFDVRAAWTGTEWRTFHFELGHPIQVLLNDIRKYLDEVPTEVVVLEVSHLVGKPTGAQKARLVAMIDNTLGKYLYPYNVNGFKDSIATMVQQNRRAVVSLDDDAAIVGHPGLWPGSTMLNSYANSDNITVMLAYNVDQVARYNGVTWPKQLYKISWTLTPGAAAILGSLDPKKPHSLKELADTANAQLDAWATVEKAKSMRLGNLFLIDHFENSDIINVVQMNL